MRNSISRITIKGYKTIADLTDFQPGALTVLIGANGAGKSNFISFFRLLSWMLVSPGNLQQYVGEQGGANMLLHDGAAVTKHIETEITTEQDDKRNQYSFVLSYAANDALIFVDERFRHTKGEKPRDWFELGSGHRESRLIEQASQNFTAKVMLAIMQKMKVFQFHNTSSTARMRGKWSEDDNRWLKEDAANLAPFLLRLKSNEPRYYSRVVENIRLMLPFFADFELASDYGRILLQWREMGSDRIFSASQAADGMLRLMALVALLLQPEDDLPDVLILDEPELGLHPFAINLIGGLIKSASTKTQVIVATQSMPLVDCFDPEDLVVVERNGRESTFQRLDGADIADWLKEYSLSELWEKNVLGGRPK